MWRGWYHWGNNTKAIMVGTCSANVRVLKGSISKKNGKVVGCRDILKMGRKIGQQKTVTGMPPRPAELHNIKK